MPDITMCDGGKCTLKNKCHRFTATPSKIEQSYFITPPFKKKSCEYFWDDKGWKKYTKP